MALLDQYGVWVNGGTAAHCVWGTDEDMELMARRGIPRNRLRTLTGIKYDVIDRYYKNEVVSMVDMDFLAKVCYVLDCRVEDILEYEKPAEPAP